MVALAGDSGRLITGSADQTAKLWNVQSGQQFSRWYLEVARMHRLLQLLKQSSMIR